MAIDPITEQPIFRGSTSVGLRNVGSYQVSGIPWTTGSDNLNHATTHMIEFPYVTKRVVVYNTTSGSVDPASGTRTGKSKAILVHFESGSSTTALTKPGDSGAQTISPSSDVIAGFHYVPVLISGSVDMNIKCKKLYICQFSGDADGAYQVFAELTNIPTRRMFLLTGSGITE